MLGLIIFGIIAMIAVIIVQLSKVSDLASAIKGEETSKLRANNRTAFWLVIFMVVFLVFCVVSALYYKNSMLGYGPHGAASSHGVELDGIFNTTLIITGIVFVITQILLFWFSYKYREDKNRKATFFAHSTQLELVWTGIPVIVMTYLVVKGLFVWNATMADVKPGENVIDIEATGYQFAWDIRYPGADGKIGTKNFRLIDLATNPLGQDWSDPKNIDDFMPTEIVLPVNQKVRVGINSKDVLHNFYLPHFRVKMDAVPGLPTYFVFTPTMTTDDYRQRLKDYPEYQVPADDTDPEGPQRWETFDYELACAELCGKGHYSMRKVVRIVSQEEYDLWLQQQSSYYLTNIRGTDVDPFRDDKLLGIEIEQRKEELTTQFTELMESDVESGVINLENVFFESGSSALDDVSQYELENVANLLKKYPNVNFELSGHTDSQGDESANLSLSQSRADQVASFLRGLGTSSDRMKAKGYGESAPVESNDTAEGRQANRRTELKIISK